ncbi:unnamed protein product [Allacma fusca]|uniref:Ubiquitin-like protease family profile domain-containing protein n=1 Tax=Allacma fusca TaxID=39272 RepID=A0A8J2LTN2_9HEXA|nr:unnamed protein product [Allacma fusca]
MDSRKYNKDVKKLLRAETTGEYEKCLNQFCPNDYRNNHNTTDAGDEYEEYDRILEDETDDDSDTQENDVDHVWDDKFRSYFFAYQDRDFRNSFRGAMSKFGIFNLHSGVTNNPAENINSTIKRFKLKDDTTLYNYIRQVTKWQNTILYDIKKEIKHERGNFIPLEKYLSQMENLPLIEINKGAYIFRNNDRETAQPESKYRIDWDINWGATKEEAMDCISNEAVHQLVTYGQSPVGVWIVESETKDLFDPKHKDMQMKPTNITDVYNYYAEQAGKKTGQARQRAKFATHNTTQTSGSEEQLFIPVDAKQVLFNIEKVELPQLTQETSRKPIFRIGGESLSLMDLKSIPSYISPDELNSITERQTSVNSANAELNESNIPNLTEHFRPGNMDGRNYNQDSNLFSNYPGELPLRDANKTYFPHHVNNNHWILLVAEKDKRSISAFMDRLNKPWKLCYPKTSLQQDGKRCGPFVCHFETMFEHGKSLSYAPHDNFRDEVLITITGQCIVQRALDHDSDIDDDLYNCDICGSADESKSGADKWSHWISCNKCRSWRHLKHTNLTPAEADDVPNWFCT